jgi:hypothetical protein
MLPVFSWMCAGSRLIALAAVACLVGGLSAGAQELRLPKVEIEQAPQTDFTRFHTYAWKASQEVAAQRSTHVNLTWHIERGLEKKGLAKAAASEADLLVRYYLLGLEDKVRGTPSQAEGPAGDTRTSVSFDRVKTGTLVLELSRGDAEGFVWRASTPFRVSDARRVEDDIRSAVGRLLGRYPPPPVGESPKPRP